MAGKQEAGSNAAPTPDKFVLQYPVSFAGVTTTEFQPRRLKAKALRKLESMDDDSIEGMFEIAAMVLGTEVAIVEEMDMVDWVRVQELIVDFFPQALQDRALAEAGPSAPTSSPASDSPSASSTGSTGES